MLANRIPPKSLGLYGTLLLTSLIWLSAHQYRKHLKETSPSPWSRDLDMASVSDEEVRAFWAARGVRIDPHRFIRQDGAGQKIDDIQAYRSNVLLPQQHKNRDLIKPPVSLDINSSDVLVVLHIQKTGGTTLEDALVQHTTLQPPCRCGPMPDCSNRLMCACVNSKGQDWLFNRHAVGWPCGVHPGYMELTSCVDQWYRSQRDEGRVRRYYYVTVLRDPVSRFVSEWLHVRRGATWKECRLHCDGRDATEQEVPFCFRYGTWKDVTFDEFMSCQSNMAFNRQTRMLANLSLSDCYRRESNLTRQQRDEIMLQSAKENLARFFTFFGLMEYQRESQLLLEHTFIGLKMSKDFSVRKGAMGTNYAAMSESHWERVIERNLLDIRLYQYAKDLFFQRLKRAKIPLQQREHMFEKVGVDFTYKFSSAG